MSYNIIVSSLEKGINFKLFDISNVALVDTQIIGNRELSVTM